MNKAVVFGTIGVLRLGGGGAAYMFLFKDQGADVEAAKPALPAVFLQLEQLSVPLPRAGKPPIYHFVVLSLQTTEPGKAELAAMMPRLRDAWLRDLNANPVARKDDPTELDMDLLKQRILQLTEQVMQGPVATDVLIVRAARGG
jgi:hypothetical protein